MSENSGLRICACPTAPDPFCTGLNPCTWCARALRDQVLLPSLLVFGFDERRHFFLSTWVERWANVVAAVEVDVTARQAKTQVVCRATIIEGGCVYECSFTDEHLDNHRTLGPDDMIIMEWKDASVEDRAERLRALVTHVLPVKEDEKKTTLEAATVDVSGETGEEAKLAVERQQEEETNGSPEPRPEANA